MNTNETNGKEISDRDRWVRDRFNEYISREGREDAYLRGLHYFIVTIDQADPRRQIPLRGKARTYRNTLNEYKNLSSWVVDARMKGLIPWALLQDHKNDQISRGAWTREEASLNDVSGYNSGSFSFTFDKMDNWEDYRDSVTLEFTEPHFAFQDKRLIVIVEKSKNKGEIERLCRKHGADFIQFGGQHSVTRLYQLTKLAREENKAMRIFHLVDLDIAGWFMPQAIMKRVQEIYPNPDHESIRVCLTRKQADTWNLPESFDPISDKDYKTGLVEKFEKETGSKVCIELDGVPRDLLITTIREALTEYSALDKDDENLREVQDKYTNIYKNLKEDFFYNEDEIVEKSEEYQAKVDRFNEIIDAIKEEVESYSDEMETLETDISNIHYDIEEMLKKRILKEGKDED